jgi:hypothetical protein
LLSWVSLVRIYFYYSFVVFIEIVPVQPQSPICKALGCKGNYMRPIDVFDFFVALGRVEAGITLSRAAGLSDDEIENSLRAVIDHLPPFMGSWIENFENDIGNKVSTWPPENIQSWQKIVKRIEYIAFSGDPQVEALWRISGALGYILWVPMPKELKHLLAEQLLVIGLNKNLIDKINNGFNSSLDKERIYSVEIIRNLFRLESNEKINASITPKTLSESVNEVILLQPNFFGIGINLNMAIKKWLQNNIKGQ